MVLATNLCYECDFDYDALRADQVAGLLRSFPSQYRDAASGVSVEIMRTPSGPWTWSALEYLCHVRDVFAINDERFRRVVAADTPELGSMNRDVKAIVERYNEQDPAEALTAFESHAEALAAFVETLDEKAWQRTGVYPVAGELPLLWMAANLVHEGRHHLMDVKRVIAAVSR